MTRRLGLRGRLLASYLAVVVVVAGVGIVATQLLTPELFARGMRDQPSQTSPGGPRTDQGGRDDIEQTYDDALRTASVVAGVAGIALAAGLALVFSRRVLRPVRDVQDASRRMADGDYRTAVPVPTEPELASLVESVNHLGTALATTEQLRAQLVSDLAHELRNPLTTIEGYMDALTDGVLPPTPETYDDVATEARRLRRLTEDLSLLSRAQEGAWALMPVPVDLATVVTTATDRLRPRIDRAELALHVDLPTPLPVVVDPERITQVLTNLLDNALAHTPAGGNLWVSGTHDGATCRIEVRDDGEGIPPEHLEEVFHRFTRLGGGPGIGIGLDIARHLATAHGGTLTARSDGPGTGATFVLTLPSSPGPVGACER